MGYPSNIRLPIGEMPEIKDNPQVFNELQQVYNAIHILNQGLNTLFNQPEQNEFKGIAGENISSGDVVSVCPVNCSIPGNQSVRGKVIRGFGKVYRKELVTVTKTVIVEGGESTETRTTEKYAWVAYAAPGMTFLATENVSTGEEFTAVSGITKFELGINSNQVGRLLCVVEATTIVDDSGTLTKPTLSLNSDPQIYLDRPPQNKSAGVVGYTLTDELSIFVPDTRLVSYD